jgi:hypothetical protein
MPRASDTADGALEGDNTGGKHAATSTHSVCYIQEVASSAAGWPTTMFEIGVPVPGKVAMTGSAGSKPQAEMLTAVLREGLAQQFPTQAGIELTKVRVPHTRCCDWAVTSYELLGLQPTSCIAAHHCGERPQSVI